MPYVWRAHRKDGDGKVQTFVQRGPANEAEARQAAERDLCLAPARRAVESGAPMPALSIAKVEPVGDDESPLGGWVPEGARPVDLDQFAARNPDGTIVNSPEALAAGNPATPVATAAPATRAVPSPKPASDKP